ncbi:hypothetical protein, partial [Pseudomonas syringae group genomosp. 7]|uniref:hypothetical protein n=1 Tax=Pseudomonas syringae group genomosp. 7 TaxID=251699 RepID=UPI00376FF3E6
MSLGWCLCCGCCGGVSVAVWGGVCGGGSWGLVCFSGFFLVGGGFVVVFVGVVVVGVGGLFVWGEVGWLFSSLFSLG